MRPIKRLQVAAEAIGAGAYDERIELERRDELGRPCLLPSTRWPLYLQELIGGLERKVAERTRALEVARCLQAQVRVPREHVARAAHAAERDPRLLPGLEQKLFGGVNEKQEEYLEDIHSSADHLLALINDVLDLSKVEAGQVELEVALLAPRGARAGRGDVRERAARTGCGSSSQLEPEVADRHGDERRIRQVVFNLLSNAVKFTPDGRRGSTSARHSRTGRSWSP